MKIKLEPMPYVNKDLKLASGWAFDAVTKTMSLYENGIKIQSHICNKDYPHDVFDENSSTL